MLKLTDVNKITKGKKILNHMTMEVKTGTIYGFIGHNGAGKSTTMRSILGLTKISGGQIMCEVDRAHIGYLPEDPRFYTYMTGTEYLNFVGANHKEARSTQKSGSLSDPTAKELMEMVGLEKASRKQISTYSRGMRQRLGMAAALVNNPEFLILDEPTSALDPLGRHQLFEIIRKLKGQGKTILLSTHILDDIEKISDKIGLIVDGRIVQEGTVEEILMSRVQEVYVAEFVTSPSQAIQARISQENWVQEVVLKDRLLEIRVYDLEMARKNLLHLAGSLDWPLKGFWQKKASLDEIFLGEVADL